MSAIGQRIAVIGVTGSGKSTLAKQLAALYDLHYIELDNLFWKPNWQMADADEFLASVKQELAKSERWVVDGNYLRTGAPYIWQYVDTLVWLDYPLRVNLWRLWKRIWGRFLRRDKLWDAQNTETVWRHFLTKESLFLHAIKSHPEKRRQYTTIFHSGDYAHLCKVHLQSPEQTEHWLQELMREIG